ncbi:hypothetical protein BX661DRAFT_178197 [Kickxella alabastrina]|uniref:uncharacterized protein n=1 Tax=Kickxella alabastrina TaxID=61397 RepID=UPI00221F0AB1|nr:uncharacterized protein BX661DRAFT_178197 [Kickxella alabastrina]KAI7833341.1 hypothetical protein BX661DRAFT_178197 [Kickxella alabastrina]
MILGGLPVGSSSASGRVRPGVRMGTRTVDGVEMAFDSALPGDAAVEAVVARVCRESRVGRVAADVVPVLALALQERLRAYMELVSAAAHHRTRTQTLPPPPLDPTTRLPLYKITPHQDVRRQLAVVERSARLREAAREQALASSSAATSAPAAEAEADAGAAPAEGPSSASPEPPESVDAARPKRPRKRDDALETAAYTSKNMPDEVRNKISNQTALRAAGGVRKSWMNAAASASVAAAAKSDAASASASSAATPNGDVDAAPDTPVSAADRPPPGLLSHRSTSLAAPLLVTVRDCLFSLERERLGNVRVGRGGGDRVLIQAYAKYVKD